MKKRMTILVIAAFVIAMLTTASIAVAKAASFSKITGHSYFFIEDWGNTEIWNRFVVNENARTHALSGLITVKITNPYVDVPRSYETTPVCVNTYNGEDGSNWAILVHRITAKGVSGWGPGEPLEYAKWKIHDTGLADGEGDLMYLAYECYDPNFENTCDTDGDGIGDAPYDEFWPADGEPPACDDTSFDIFPLEVDEGNIVIH